VSKSVQSSSFIYRIYHIQIL